MEFQNPYVTVDIALIDLLRNMGLGLIIAVVWTWVLGRASRLVVDTRQYLPVFLLLIPSMILIISIIKSSIALSLGLVGALSIVRFRTPIKEPEELLYLFVAIAVGLGLGANQLAATLIGFVAICLGMIVLSFVSKPLGQRANTYLDINFSQNDIDIEKFKTLLDDLEYKFAIKRINSNDGLTEILVDIANFDMTGFSALQTQLKTLNADVSVVATENARIIT